MTFFHISVLRGSDFYLVQTTGFIVFFRLPWHGVWTFFLGKLRGLHFFSDLRATGLTLYFSVKSTGFTLFLDQIKGPTSVS